MESLLLGALSFYGNMNPNRIKEQLDNNNNYDTNIEQNMNNIEKNQANVLKNQPDYFQQFDSLTFDNLSKPTAENQAYMTKSGFNNFLQRNLDFQNGYSDFQNTDMHYGVVTKENFVHNNMYPSTARRETMINLNSNNRKYENLSGNNNLWQHKSELETFFAPVKDMTNVNGMKAVSGELTSRYIPSLKNNNGNLPFQTDVQVRPGVDGKTAAPYAVVRIEPRGIDELRSEINRKETYLNKPLEVIKKGDLRANAGELTHFKMPVYREQKFSDLVANKHDTAGVKQTGKFVHIDTERGTKDIEYKGGAYDSRQGKSIDPEAMYFSEAKKENYLNDFTHAINAVNSRPVFTNAKSYTNYETDRDTISTEVRATGAYNNTQSSYYFDGNDAAKPTMKQNNIIQDRNLGINGALEKKTYMFSNDSILPTTHRESTNYNDVGNSAPTYKNPNVHYTDEARQTIRETTEDYTHLGNTNTPWKNTHLGYQDEAKQTIRESTEDYTHLGGANTPWQNTHVTFQDKAKSTIKETTEEYTHLGNTNAPWKNTHIGYQDEAKSTIRETTEDYTHLGNSNAPWQNTHLTYQDKAKSTIKETTEDYTHLGNSNTLFQNTHVTYQDKAKSTIKETTVDHVIDPSITSAYQNTHVTYQDKAKPTIKQTTVISSIISNAAPTYTANVTHYTDEARKTIRETTEINNHTGTANAPYKNTHLNYQDEAKSTQRQTTENNNYIGIVGGDNNKETYTILEDDAKKTIRETTLFETPIQNIVANVTQAYTKNDEEARPTIKQTLLHQAPGGRMYNYNQSNYKSIEDARATIKETTVDNEHIGGASYNINALRTMDAEKNMCIRDKRQQTALGARPGNAKSDTIRGNINADTVKFQNKRTLLKGYVSTPGNSSNYSVTPSQPIVPDRKTHLHNNFYRIDPLYIDTLNNNPLVNDLMHQKNVNFDTGSAPDGKGLGVSSRNSSNSASTS